MIIGLSRPSTAWASSRSSMPSRRGTEKPQMSASSTPTVKPSRGDRSGEVDGDRATCRRRPCRWRWPGSGSTSGTSVSGAFSRAFQRALSHDLGAFLAGHLTPVDLDLGHAGVHGDPGLDVLLDLGAQRAAADRQLDADGDHAVVGHVDRRDHAERDDVGAELGVDHRPQQVGDRLDIGRSWESQHQFYGCRSIQCLSNRQEEPTP